MATRFVPILKLDDDNHAPCYIAKFGYYWENAEEFMEDTLVKPHLEEYRIKKISLVDLREDVLYKGMTLEEMFSYINCNYGNRTNEKVNLIFDFFWNADDDELYDSI